MTKRWRRLGLVLIVAAAFVACTGKITQTNFSKISNGMTYDQVVAVLGEPTESESLGLGPLSGTKAKWEDHRAVISITFVNKKVKLKSFSTKSRN